MFFEEQNDFVQLDSIETEDNNAQGAQNRRLEELIGYAKRGFSVVPVQPQSKIPALPWAQYMKRRPSEEDVRSWFENGLDMNASIITGAISGIVVLDIDGQAGFDRLAKLGELPVTPTVITGRGKHFYFRHPGFVVPCKLLLPQVELRGEKGLVVVPPSVHPSGGKYRWEVGLDIPLANLPLWLLDIKEEKHETSQTSALSRKVRAETDRLIVGLLRSTEGNRNENLNKAADLLP